MTADDLHYWAPGLIERVPGWGKVLASDSLGLCARDLSSRPVLENTERESEEHCEVNNYNQIKIKYGPLLLALLLLKSIQIIQTSACT